MGSSERPRRRSFRPVCERKEETSHGFHRFHGSTSVKSVESVANFFGCVYDVCLMRRMAWSLTLLVALAAGLRAQAPRETPAIKPVPPPGIEVPEQDRAALEEGLSELAREIEQLRANKPAASLLADTEIYYKAVRTALKQREFFAPADIEKARKLLVQGRERARLLVRGESGWQAQHGPAALAYLSEIDGSVQPYGLYIPA